MKYWGLAVAVACAFAASACDEDGPTAPSNAPLVYAATLSPANEVPPITNAESTATGSATITITPTRDSGNVITGGTVSFAFSVSGLTASSSIRGAHIHSGAAGVAGPIVVDTGLTAATAIATPIGSAAFQSPTPVSADAATINAIVSNPGNYYFNVHTVLNPGGALRGQLRAN